MTSTPSSYLSMLRTEHRGSITVILGLLVGGLMVWLPGIIILTLAYGMYLRTQRCKVIPGRTGALDAGPLAMIAFPLWPALVAVDLVGDWMREVGFGAAFRVSVTTILFASCWSPFVDWSWLSAAVVLGTGLLTAVARDRQLSVYVVLAPSLLTIGLVVQRWSL